MGDTVSGLVVLGSQRKQTEQAIGSKSVRSNPQLPLHSLLCPGSYHVWISILSSFSDEE